MPKLILQRDPLDPDTIHLRTIPRRTYAKFYSFHLASLSDSQFRELIGEDLPTFDAIRNAGNDPVEIELYIDLPQEVAHGVE